MSTKSGPSKTKQAWDAKSLMDDIMAKHGIDPDAPDALERVRVALVAEPPPPPRPAVPVVSATQKTVPTDDLWWITGDVFEVHLVARKLMVNLRPRRDKVNPPIEAIGLKPYSDGEWVAMPFSLRFDDHEKQKRLRMKYAKWNRFVVTRETASDMWGDPRWPIPTKAVISHEDYRGWSGASHRAMGTYRDLVDPDELREAVRRLLQRGAGQVFLNWSRMGEIAQAHPTLITIANPYGNYLDETAMPVVRTAPDDLVTTEDPAFAREKRA